MGKKPWKKLGKLYLYEDFLPKTEQEIKSSFIELFYT